MIIRRKIYGNSGFTIAELLVCLLILIITASSAAAIISGMVRSQQKNKFETDRIKLESALNTSFYDTLSMAYDIKSDNEKVVFTSDIGKNVYLTLQEGIIAVVHTDGNNRPFVSESYYGKVKISEFTISYDQNTRVFSVEYTVYDHDGKEKIYQREIMCIT